MANTVELSFSPRNGQNMAHVDDLIRNCRMFGSDICIRIGNHTIIRTNLGYYFGNSMHFTFGLKNPDNFVSMLTQNIPIGKMENITLMSNNDSFAFRAIVV